jgi:hypothetical protein
MIPFFQAHRYYTCDRRQQTHLPPPFTLKDFKYHTYASIHKGYVSACMKTNINAQMVPTIRNFALLLLKSRLGYLALFDRKMSLWSNCEWSNILIPAELLKLHTFKHMPIIFCAWEQDQFWHTQSHTEARISTLVTLRTCLCLHLRYYVRGYVRVYVCSTYVCVCVCVCINICFCQRPIAYIK